MYVIDSGKVTGHYYRCASSYKPWARGKCKSTYTRLSLLEAAVWNNIKERMQDEELVRSQLEFALSEAPEDKMADSISFCEEALAKIEKGQQRLVKSLMQASDETADLIERELLSLGEKRKEIKRELDVLLARHQSLASKKINIEWILDNLHLIAQGLEDFDFNERRMFLDAMNLRVETTADRFRFSFYIPTNPVEGRYVVSGQISGNMSLQPVLVRR
jgi:hypothetical protein